MAATAWFWLLIALIIGVSRVRAGRWEQRGLCMRCGRHPPVTTVFDINVRLRICTRCAEQLELPTRDIGWLPAALAAGAFGATLGAFVWALFEDSLPSNSLPSLLVAGTIGGFVYAAIHWIRGRRVDRAPQAEGPLREPLSPKPGRRPMV